ncbi:MAG: hypothetical protein H6525_07970 [Actinobacteria bacterium]|nr:hypothetical protein [Actinomycetota bacterium]MCB9412768.1 hypothetical protein [Actinomycetota bacterium]
MTTVPGSVVAIFPQAVELHEFLDQTGDVLAARGFHPGEALAVTAGCRDEIAAEYRAEIRRRWDQSFDFASLSGLPFAGVTGMRAVFDHVPHVAGHPEVVIFAMPHIGVLADGTMGRAMRRGRSRPTTACGSLLTAIQAARGVQPTPPPECSDRPLIDPLDPEQSLVQFRLAAQFGDISTMSPVDLVRGVAELMVTELWQLLAAVTIPGEDDVALVGGILIHGPDGNDYVSPYARLIRSDGVLTDERFDDA